MQRKSFLIIYPCRIEETVAALVLLQYFKRGIIDWVVSYEAAPLVRGQGKVRNVYTPDQLPLIRQMNYEVAFDIHSGLLSGLILAASKAKEKITSSLMTSNHIFGSLFATKRFGVERRFAKEEQCLSLPMDFRRDSKPWPEHIELNYSIDTWEKWEINYLVNQVGRPRFLVSPGARFKAMEISAKKWIAFLHSLNVPVILYYHRQRERYLIDEIADSVDDVIIAGKWRPGKLQNLIKCMDGVIGVDSLAVQLAKTTKTRTLSFYGATRHKVWAKDQHLQNRCPHHMGFDQQCPHIGICQSRACMDFDAYAMIQAMKTTFDDKL